MSGLRAYTEAMHQCEFIISNEYINEFFSQTYRHDRIRAYFFYSVAVFAIVISLLMLMLSIAIAVPIVLLLFSCYELFGYPFKRYLWKKKFPDTKGLKQIYTFTDTHIKSESEQGRGELLWNALFKSKETKKGFLIWIQRNLHVYIPKSSMNDDSIEYLRSKIFKNNEA